MKTSIKIIVIWLFIHTVAWLLKMWFNWQYDSYIWWIKEIPYDESYRYTAFFLNLFYAIGIIIVLNPDKEDN